MTPDELKSAEVGSRVSWNKKCSEYGSLGVIRATQEGRNYIIWDDGYALCKYAYSSKLRWAKLCK